MLERSELTNLIQAVVLSVDNARAVEAPFYHLEFDRVFPEDIYERILVSKPVYEDYRPMSGRSKGHVRADGTATRVKIDLLPELIRKLPAHKRQVWNLAHMLRHQWAAEQMWDGLIGPSEARWNDGVTELAEAPLGQDEIFANATATPAIGKLATDVHALAAEGRKATTWDDRAAVYGRLLASCAACHAAIPRAGS